MKFRNLFATFGSDRPVPDDFKDWFENYDEDRWLEEGDSSLEFELDDGRRLSLVIGQSPGIFMLTLQTHLPDGSLPVQVLVSDRDKLDAYVDFGVDEVPQGVTFEPQEAWRRVKFFLEQPTQLTSAFDAVDYGDLEWGAK